MKQILIILSIALLAQISFSCKQTKKQGDPGNTTIKDQGLIPVDYRHDIYKVFLGESFKVSDKIINWGWDGMADDDNKADSTGKDAFLSLNEPLIGFNGSDILRSLHIKTNKNLITRFTCSVLFDLGDSTGSRENFLKLMSKDIKQLKNKWVIESILQSGYYEKKGNNYTEMIELKPKDSVGYDEFSYVITSKI